MDVDMSRIERQLEPSLGKEESRTVSSLAGGVLATLNLSGFWACLTSAQKLSAIAAVYGMFRRVCVEESTNTEANDLYRESAQTTHARMGDIVFAMDAPDPNPPKPLSFEEQLRAAGIIPAGAGVAGTTGDTQGQNGQLEDPNADPVDAALDHALASEMHSELKG